MHNFTYCTPTKVIFGRGSLSQLGSKIKAYGQRILLVYGGGSIKRSGLYQQVLAQLSGSTVFELNGVDPNPRVTSVDAGAALCRQHQIETVLAVGGGSVIDCAKAVCAAACYAGPAWDLVLDNTKVTKALPLCTVLTLAATGSEYDWGCVISNTATHEKLPIVSPLLFPRLSILDPEYTFSVPAFQTAAGSADIMSHLMEQYFVAEHNQIADGIIETLLRTVMRNSLKAIAVPDDYEARAQLMWAASLACNGICSLGNSITVWPCHGLEHELSAVYDITHGEGLAIITPHWMRFCLKHESARSRLAQFARKVMGIKQSTDDFNDAQSGIEALAAFFKQLGLRTNLRALNIQDDRCFAQMADHLLTHWMPLSQSFVPLTRTDIINIYKASL